MKALAKEMVLLNKAFGRLVCSLTFRGADLELEVDFDSRVE